MEKTLHIAALAALSACSHGSDSAQPVHQMVNVPPAQLAGAWRGEWNGDSLHNGTHENGFVLIRISVSTRTGRPELFVNLARDRDLAISLAAPSGNLYQLLDEHYHFAARDERIATADPRTVSLVFDHFQGPRELVGTFELTDNYGVPLYSNGRFAAQYAGDGSGASRIVRQWEQGGWLFVADIRDER